jgi:hypothetical protein
VSGIAEKRDVAAERVRHLKEQKVADWRESDRPELHPTVIGWRGDTEVAVMVTMRVDRDEGLRAAHLMAVGFGCDALAFCVDTWSSKDLINPVTGREWAQNEMQDVVEHHQGIERGWILEALNTFVVNRAGDLAASYQGYRQTKHGYGKRTTRWTLEWTESRVSDPTTVGARHEGLVIRALHRAMNTDTTGQWLGRLGLSGADFGLDDVETMAHADCAVVKTLAAAGFEGGVLLSSDDPRRAAIIEESLADYRADL